MTTLLVRLSNSKLNDYKWLGQVENIVDVLPHGSGFDGKWEVDFDSSDDQIIISNGYHAMDGNGFYSGWLNFTISLSRPDQFDDNGIFNDPYLWYQNFDIEYDDSDLDYDDGSEEYEFNDDDFDEDGEVTEDGLQKEQDWLEMENPAVDKDSLIEYIEDTICNALQGIVSAVILEDEE